jgi:hypothetical protein
MKNFPQQLTHGSGAPMFLDKSRLLLAFQEEISHEKLERFLKALDLVLEGDVQAEAVPGERVNHTDRRFWIQSRRPIEDAYYQKIEESAAKLGLDWISPVYRLSGEEDRKGLLAPLPNVVIVKMRELEGDVGAVHKAIIAAATDGPSPQLQEVLEKSKYLSGYRYFVIANPREVNAYQIRQRLLESKSGIVADVQFETMPLIVPTAVSPNDTLFGQQWDMARIQAGGAGTTGWDISTGVASVVVCVLDEGFAVCNARHQFGHDDARWFAHGQSRHRLRGHRRRYL